MLTIYCAGPLFTTKEREEMVEIADALEQSGYSVFLPQRDGIEMVKHHEEMSERGIPESDIKKELSKSIFIIDTQQVIKSDGLLLNMNGRVPDEGAMVEAGIAWALHKRIVIYKDDSRTMLLGEDNPLVVGLAAFQIVNKIKDIAVKFEECFRKGQYPLSKDDLSRKYTKYITG